MRAVRGAVATAGASALLLALPGVAGAKPKDPVSFARADVCHDTRDAATRRAPHA